MTQPIEKSIYQVAIYIRLSKEDVDRGYDESESIKNQKTLLTQYSEIMKAIINKIEIHQDKQVDIIFNYRKLNNKKRNFVRF